MKQKTPKRKICIDCKKEKDLEEFPNQSNSRGKRYSSDGKRTECKKCHQRKTTKAYKDRTTIEDRRTYMREYMRKYKAKRDEVSIN
jgi:cytochrome c553